MTLDSLRASLADRYRIERELGSGGMATVYLAHDVKHDRPVALKVLRQDLASELGADRFVREIRLAARLSHPHILPLYDSGEAGGFLYFVMPLAEGESLRDRLRKAKQLAVDEALQIAREVADALDYAHRHDVVHRDVKPENILLHEGHAVIADFGIGKAIAAAAEPDTLTRPGVTVGTPAYMSPEQAAGDAIVDGRSDLYALGCVMYEMLTGEPPFTGPTAQAVIAKRFTDAPPEVTKTRPAVPLAASRAIAKLLERTPADRFATGTQLVEALQSGAGPAPAVIDERSIAVLPFANLSADPDNEYFSDGITEEIINALSRLDALHVASRTSSFTFKGRGHDLKAVSAKLRVKHALEGSVRRAGARVRIAVQLVHVERDITVWSERYDRQIDDIFAVQDEIATAIAGKLEATLGGTQPTSLVAPGTASVEAYEEYLKGRHFWVQRGPGLAHAAAHFQRATELDPRYAQAYAGLADTYGLYGLYGLVAPADAWPMARVAIERVVSIDPSDADVQCASGAFDLWFGWDLRRAVERFRTAIRINPRHARAWAWLAQLNGLLGEMDVVREAALHAHEADPLSPLIHGIVASGFVFGRCYDDAIRYADSALELDPGHHVANWARGYACSAVSRHDDAVAACERSVATLSTGLTLAVLAVVYARAGRWADVAAARARLATLSYPKWLDALVLVAEGHLEQAVDAAIVAVRERHWTGWAGGCAPFLEAVTEHPRWQSAMREVGLGWVVEQRLLYNAGAKG